MKHISVVVNTVILLLSPLLTFAQLQVSFPTSRAVFQRNAANQGQIRITGSYTTPITRVEAKLTARNGQGQSTDWQVVQNNPAGGTYTGDLTGTGGWYNVEVRGINSDQQVAYTVVERVGIGEVFVVAGQSNAQGVHRNAPEPTDDRVNCANFYYDPAQYTFPAEPPAPTFSRLTNDANPAPRGIGSWCWGRLGDLLVARLGVPVLFYNAAFTGTAVENWRDSAPDNGIAYGYFGQPYAPRQPFVNLKLAVQFYANQTGIRAVLWHQGEADNVFGTSTANYVASLQYIINKSRSDYGKNVSWVVARASYGDFIGVSPRIIAGQNQVIAQTPNVFAGPSTDTIQVPRKRPPLNDVDGLHFDFNGLVEVANAWNSSLTDQFFGQSTPYGPAPLPTLSVACAGNNQLRFTVNGNYPAVQWESGETGPTVTKGAGPYRARVKDSNGNTTFTAQARVPDAPVITTVDNRPLAICAGSSLGLTTIYDNVTWLNSASNPIATGRTVSVGTAGSYSARYRDVNGCDFNSSAVSLSVNPLPAQPVVTSDQPTTFCQGNTTVLRTSTDNVRYAWSNGQQDRAITVGTPGVYSVSVIDQNGCSSAPSVPITVTVNPLPIKPVVATNGPTTFCADQSVTLTAPEETAYQWSNGQTSRSQTINQAGTFSVQTRNQFGCISERSDVITTRVNPLPDAPGITAFGRTTFCDGNQVRLAASTPLDVVWSGGQTDKTISVGQSGTYTARSRDQNGCLSPASPAIVVTVNPLPSAPTLLSSRPPTICDGDQITFSVNGPYTVLWSTGDSTRSIVTGRAGSYAARVRDANGCVSPLSTPTVLDVKPLPPAPTVNIVGTYTLEAVSSTNSPLFRWRRNGDSLAVQTAIIKANQSGTYTARSSTTYSTTLVCYSLPSAGVAFVAEQNNRGLSIYPNPNPDKVVTLETFDNLADAVVTVYTLTGQSVATYAVPLFDERKQLVLTDLPPGTYLLRVQAPNFDVSKRILLGL